MASVAMGLSRSASKARPHWPESRLRIASQTTASTARQSQKKRRGVRATPKSGGRVTESPCEPAVSHSSSVSTVVVRARKLRVASANCGPSSRSDGSASSAPMTVQTAPAASTASGMLVP